MQEPQTRLFIANQTASGQYYNKGCRGGIFSTSVSHLNTRKISLDSHMSADKVRAAGKPSSVKEGPFIQHNMVRERRSKWAPQAHGRVNTRSPVVGEDGAHIEGNQVILANGKAKANLWNLF